MKVKIDEKFYLSKYSDYIKSNCANVRDIYYDAVYFQNDEDDFGASWSYSYCGCKDPKIIVQQLNGLLGTKFELEE
jgi:hypothetical protein